MLEHGLSIHQYNKCVYDEAMLPLWLFAAAVRSPGKKNSGVLIGKLDKKRSC